MWEFVVDFVENIKQIRLTCANDWFINNVVAWCAQPRCVSGKSAKLIPLSLIPVTDV